MTVKYFRVPPKLSPVSHKFYAQCSFPSKFSESETLYVEFRVYSLERDRERERNCCFSIPRVCRLITLWSAGDVGGATPTLDLGSQIRAKLASRKPMSTSPTQKEPPAGKEMFKRSNTMSSQPSLGEIR